MDVTIAILLGSAAFSYLLFALFMQYVPYVKIGARVDTPSTHVAKHAITFGGVVCFFSIVVINLLCASSNILLLVHAGLFFMIGLLDDFYKWKYRVGISTLCKAMLQCLGFGIVLMQGPYLGAMYSTHYTLITVFLFFVILGTINAVNIVDGLDLLATVTIFPILLFLFAVGSYVGQYDLQWLLLTMIGVLISFGCYNKSPALIWMGDCGSLFFGALIALIALQLGVAWFLPLAGIVLVLETLSVILQIVSRRIYNVKLFKLAPFHHHLELSGYTEKQIVLFFGMISTLSSGCAFGMWLLIQCYTN